MSLKEELSGGGYLEDPTAGMDGMAEVRRRLLAVGVETPLASNVAVTRLRRCGAGVATDAVQVVSLRSALLGRPSRHAAAGAICARRSAWASRCTPTITWA